MKKVFGFLLICVFYSSVVFSQNEDLDFANQMINQRGELFFSFDRPNNEILGQLTKEISIDRVKADKVFAYANRSEFDNFLLFNIQFEPVYDYYLATKATTMATDVSQMVNWDKYPTFAVYQEMMQNFVEDYPSLCRLDTIGFSAVNNRPILCIVISDNISQIEDEPEFFWSSTMHGDELCGLILELRFADYLLSNYNSITQVTNIVNNTVVYICPMANPDGTYKNSTNGTSVANSTRYNGNYVDLNRSFPYIDGAPYDSGTNADSTQAEVVAMQNYADLHNFTMAANLHGGASLINYPWDLYGETSVLPRTNIRPADEYWWLYVSELYADLAIANSQGHTYSGAGYFQDCASEIGNDGITEGSDWYWISGSRQDYMNFFKHCREITIEVSVEKKLDVGELNNHWNFNRQAMLDYTEQVLYGFRGIITDSCSGTPLPGVKVEIAGHDELGSEVYSFSPLGNYFRPIYAGTYNVTFSKTGYISKTISVSTTNNNSTQLNVSLQPITDNSIADFTFEQPLSCSGVINFIPNNDNIDSYSWNFGDESSSNDLSPIHSYQNSGNYTVNFSVNICGMDFSSSQVISLDNIVETPTTVGDESCSIPASLTLTADGNGTLKWYDALNGGNLVNSGTSYTNIYNTTTNYYVENVISTTSNDNVGAVSKEFGSGGYFSYTNSHYLVFDALQNITINSVLVYSNQSAERTIQLLDAQDNVLDYLTLTIPNNQSGERITLNFSVSAGSGYKLALAEGTSRLYRNSDGASYPYSVDNVINIVGNSAGNTSSYYYFYDWEITSSATCSSERVPVTALIIDDFENINYTVSNEGQHCADSVSLSVLSSCDCSDCNFYWQGNSTSLINSDYESNSQYVSESGTYYFRHIIGECVSDNIPISVTLFPQVSLTHSLTPPSSSSSSDGSILVNVESGTPDFSGLWSNGQTTNGDNMSMPNLPEGNYSVTVTDANMCKDSIQNIIISYLTGIDINSTDIVELFPNPSNGNFSIKSKSLINKITIFDLLGNKVSVKENINSQIVDFKLKLNSGNYFAVIETKDSKEFRKILIK